MRDNKTLYKFNDDILFRTCSLFEGESTEFGDCTNWTNCSKNLETKYGCKQFGIHYHCAKHPAIELTLKYEGLSTTLYCPRCNKEIEVQSIEWLRQECYKLLNMDAFKDAKIIRLDDYYIPEIKADPEKVSDYWIKTEVKTDKDGDTIVIVYIGTRGEKDKVQFFIKPEKHQLTSDHNDLDPATIISKIEITLKDRKLIQEYE